MPLPINEGIFLTDGMKEAIKFSSNNFVADGKFHFNICPFCEKWTGDSFTDHCRSCGFSVKEE